MRCHKAGPATRDLVDWKTLACAHVRRQVMEIALNIPPCARVVDPRTVLVRIYSTGSRHPEERCRVGDAAERLSRISGCDCNRISEEYSGCDSVVVGRCRPKKSRSTWRMTPQQRQNRQKASAQSDGATSSELIFLFPSLSRNANDPNELSNFIRSIGDRRRANRGRAGGPTAIDACGPSGRGSALFPRTSHYPNVRRFDLERDTPVTSRARARSYRRGYVNVSATVCLLLLVGALTPRSAAAPIAPGSTETMERKHPWENPCDYTCMTQQTSYEPDMARSVANQAQNVRTGAESYRDEFAKKTHSYDSFEKLVNQWQSYEWLRNFSWVKATQQSFPTFKAYGKNVSDAQIQDFVQESKINSVLPAMYKNLQMILASFGAMADALTEPPALSELTGHVTHTKDELKSLLCSLFDVLSARGLKPETITIDLEEIPNFVSSNQEKYELLLLVYRDTLSYLEYVQQVFQAMSEMKN